ncbi:UNVERIFIED_CONTAM: hypothetical protein FKN15_062207 [Acipenser sinensis]
MHSFVTAKKANCKICELAFESEQVLLQHMKDNHKPGEMPYVCQVCSYRSSVFSDVENHFRVAHENTKHLLCPFCLKVIKCATPYMLHYMRHQVTIRASLASPGGSPTSPNASSRSIVSIIPNSPTAKQSAKAPSNQGKSRSTNQQKKQEKLSNSKLLERSLKKLSVHFGIQKCMECSADIEDCAAHYPTLYTCGVCRYKTSCKKSYAKHMIRFHSAFSREKFQKRKKHSNKLRGVTLVCLNCDFLTDASDANDMSKHLIDRPNHTCQVIVESGRPEDNAYETSQKGVSQASMSLRRNLTLNQQKKMITEERRKEILREDQIKQVAKERLFEANLMSEDRLEKKRYAEQDRILKEKQLEQEERMATELARISYEKLKDEKMRQQVRENSIELRELEGKLKSAYLNRERAAQIAEKEVLRYEKMFCPLAFKNLKHLNVFYSIELRELEGKLKSAYLNRERAAQIAEKEVLRYEKMKSESEIAHKMKLEHERASEEVEKQEMRHYEETVRYQQELEQQLEEKERKKQEAYEEFLKEKLMIDEIVRKIYDEDQTERQLKLEKMTATQRYIEEFKKQEAEWRRLERERMEEENRQIREFASFQQRREEDRMAKVREREETKQFLQSKVHILTTLTILED